MPSDNISHCFPVGNVALFDSHRDAIATFPGSSVSDWTMALNNWNTTRQSEDAGRRGYTSERSRRYQTPCRLDKREKFDLDMMALDTINLVEVGKDEGLATYEKVWEASALDHSIYIPHYFHASLFLEAISRRQKKEVELLGTLCGEISADWTWVEESKHSTNLQLAYIEALGVSHFPEWK